MHNNFRKIRCSQYTGKCVVIAEFRFSLGTVSVSATLSI
ncbi:unnamed protein product [Angiostrongylus costaricensis]|uniref:Uncharacterized protein n=1 Tax=Angiostrongylus costaricensis TaxID=334426 RepID=A0A158PEQ0_ANGCS|nr:unnamed protein product [Angiostrongylus costaricensis]